MLQCAEDSMKILVVGNSGSGRGTYARALAERHALAHLDLDTSAPDLD